MTAEQLTSTLIVIISNQNTVCLLQDSDAVGQLTERTDGLQKSWCYLSPKCSFLEKHEEEIDGKWATPGHMENNHRTRRILYVIRLTYYHKPQRCNLHSMYWHSTTDRRIATPTGILTLGMYPLQYGRQKLVSFDSVTREFMTN